MPEKTLTLRLDEHLIERAEAHAERQGTSVEQVVAEQLAALAEGVDGAEHREHVADASDEGWREALPPITRSLIGVAAGSEVTEEDYHRYLEEKHR